MSEVVNQSGTTNTLDAAAEQLESLLGGEDEVNDEIETEDVVNDEESEVEDTAEEVEDDEAEPSEDEEEEQAAIETLADLAEALDTPLEELLGQIRTTVKVDGEPLHVTLDELQAGYQKDADYRQKTESLKREREAFEARQAQIVQQFEQEHAQNADVLNTFEQALQAQMNSEQMTQLRQSDQQAYLMKRYELQDQLAGIQRIKQEASQRYAYAEQQLQAQHQEQLQQRLRQEMELRNKAIPDWDNQKGQAVAQYLVDSVGFTQAELAQAFAQSPDHRLLVLAHKAMLHDQMKASSETTKKKVKKAPRLVKPSSKSVSVPKSNVKQLRGRLRKTGNLKDAAKVIESLME